MAERWNEGIFYKRQSTLNYLDCNAQKEVFVHYILGEFSEIAGDECIENGENHGFFQRHGQVFLITRMSMKVHRRPHCCETLVFTTWFRKAEGKVFYRDCDVRTPEGELLVSLSGTWMLYDMEQQRVNEVENYSGARSPDCPLKSDCPECRKIIPAAPAAVIGHRPVRYTDLDCNYHINNAVYSAIAVDFLPEKYIEKQLKEYYVNFNRETKLGETLELRGSETEVGYIIQGYCDGVLHFAAEFVY